MYQTIDIAMWVKFSIDKLSKSNMESLVFSMLNFVYIIDCIQKKETHVYNVTFVTVSSLISIKQNLNNVNSIINKPELNNPASSKMDTGFMVTSPRINHNQNDSFDKFISLVL